MSQNLLLDFFDLQVKKIKHSRAIECRTRLFFCRRKSEKDEDKLAQVIVFALLSIVSSILSI